MKRIKLAAIVLLPALIGLIASLLNSSGVLARWKLAAAPSPEEIKLLSTVKANGNGFFQESTRDGFKEELQSCDLSMIEFSILSNKPRNRVECAQSIHYYIDGRERLTLIRDSAGNVWEWRFLFTAIKEMGNTFWPIVGLVIGLVLMIILRKKV
jgi:hypothetical protein